MTVRLGDVTFSDWVSLEYEDGFTDTFIFHVDSMNGLPPFGYRPLLQRLVAELNKKRRGASLWIRIDSPGDWYLMEIKLAMRRGLSIPYSVTRAEEVPDFRSFSFCPTLYPLPQKRPPAIENGLAGITQEQIKCLQVLVRTRKGTVDEIASLTGLSEKITGNTVEELQDNNQAVFKLGEKTQKDKSKPKEMDPYPMWHPTRPGMSIALRSWGASRQLAFSGIKEMNSHLIGTAHRTTSRRWPAWLRSAYPHAEIWSGWSETKMPGISVYPDALAWGKIQGYETLFWLEVGDNHKKRNEIELITKKRLKSAWKFCKRTGVRLVYAQLSQEWVLEAARWSLTNLPSEIAVIMGNSKKFGKLSVIEWAG